MLKFIKVILNIKIKKTFNLNFLGGYMKLIFLIIIGAIVYIVITYNELQRMAQAIKSRNSQVLVAMRKKIDLINQLIDVTKEYGNHEKLIHLSVSDDLKSMAEDSSETLNKILAFGKNFPDLKANENYITLMNNITQVENDIQNKRENYNYSVETYNSKRVTIPVVFFASSLGFKEAPYYNFDNLDTIKEFKTDDGELLKTMLNKKMEQAVQQAKNLGEKTKDLSQKTLEKYKQKNENNNEEENN